ncbi:MAG: hypothetical protein KDC84_07915 [Crocinitomicaceae bacterium]|nr:hypothetical protein [Crocinitomicaceae bacterium]
MKHISFLVLFSALLFNACSSESKDEKKEEAENALTPCDCSKMEKDKAPDECFELQKQWKAEYEVADATRKEEMTKELIDCANKK